MSLPAPVGRLQQALGGQRHGVGDRRQRDPRDAPLVHRARDLEAATAAAATVQRFPLTLGARGSATLGGLAATNALELGIDVGDRWDDLAPHLEKMVKDDPNISVVKMGRLSVGALTNDRVFNQLFLSREGKRFDEAAFDWGVAVPGDGNPTRAWPRSG